jgi:glutathione S-transferase
MSLTLYFHPLSSFSQKALVALYETGTPFTPHILEFGNEKARADFLKMWPIGKFPVLKDEARDHFVPESTIIIEYLDQHYPGSAHLIPNDPDLARQTRMRDRFFDLYLEFPMQKVVADTFRPAGQKDPIGVAQALEQIKAAYGVLEKDLRGKRWVMGDDFTMADCAACPALLYTNTLVPAHDHPNVARYLERLMARPSFRRALREAEPYVKNYPFFDKYRAAYGEIT